MKKIGLALSGGGFRATLYHLGLVRYLRDANILGNVTHITSVSGGSIIAAHMVLNWGRYTGSASEFDSASAELLDFIRLDVRNRVMRRFPLCYPLRWPRRLLGLSNRKLTLTGLLESHYERYLFGDTSLFQLPESPQLHILATNLSEGCLCSFHRDGLLMVRRQPGHGIRLDRIHAGLATVPMAVTASSAFPGFFPPIELTGIDIGANKAEFNRQAFTDGGVFDNLGVRMFRCLQETLAAEQGGLDLVIVSDVGKPFEVQTTRAGGLIRTAMRASDILMDRVWQLENEAFDQTSNYIFARITDLVEQDPTALHPEIQRQTVNIRTDLDGFSPLEISSLIRHGYCVARKVCRARPDLFGADVVGTDQLSPPWDPIPETIASRRAEPIKTMVATSILGTQRGPSAVTREARTLQGSAVRRIWTTLLDWRDWVSWVYVPVLVPVLLLTPYAVYRSYQHSYRMNRLIESISQGSPDYEIMSRLLDGPMPTWSSEPAEEVRSIEEPNFTGFDILQDSRILDLRNWNPNIAGKGDTTSLVYGYRRLKIAKNTTNEANHFFRMDLLATHPKTSVRFPPQALTPKLSMMYVNPEVGGEKQCRFVATIDFEKVPPGDIIDISYEHYSPGVFLRRGETSTSIAFKSQAHTAEVTRWFMMPRGKNYKSFRVLRYETGKPSTAEPVKGLAEYLADDSSIIAFKLASVKAGYTFEVEWYYR